MTGLTASNGFCDIDPKAYTLCPKSLESRWQDDTKAVVAVAYAGQSADMPEIARIARNKGAIVIEDACHGTGGGFQVDGISYKQGGHPWADMTTFSFHPVKTMTTGEERAERGYGTRYVQPMSQPRNPRLQDRQGVHFRVPLRF